MKLAVVDCETTGKGPEAELLELALVVVDTDDPVGVFRRTGSTLVHPVGPIPPEASAVHHITADMLVDAMDRNAARDWLMPKVSDCDAVVAHHVAFDHDFLPELHDKPWICTMIVAKHIWPDAPSYGLQVLRYWQGLDASNARATPHRAIYDAMCTAHLVLKQITALPDGDHLKQLIELTNKIPLLRVCHFGKYRGMPWADLVRKDRRYAIWVLDKSDMGSDPEVKHTLTHYLGGH